MMSDFRGAFRLPIDQVFTVKGQGTIVRGTVYEGSVEEGQVWNLYLNRRFNITFLGRRNNLLLYMNLFHMFQLIGKRERKICYKS